MIKPANYLDRFADAIRDGIPGETTAQGATVARRIDVFVKSKWSVDDWCARQTVRSGKLVKPIHVTGGVTLVHEDDWRGLDARNLPPGLSLLVRTWHDRKQGVELEVALECIGSDPDLIAREVTQTIRRHLERLQTGA